MKFKFKRELSWSPHQDVGVGRWEVLFPALGRIWRLLLQGQGLSTPPIDTALHPRTESSSTLPWEPQSPQECNHLMRTAHGIEKINNLFRSLLFWDVTRSRLTVSYRRFGRTFGTTYTFSRNVDNVLPNCVISKKTEGLIYNVAET